MSSNGKRRAWSAGDKLRIVLAGMEPNVEVSDLCRRVPWVVCHAVVLDPC